MAVTCSTFIKEYTKAIVEGNAAVFAGAGLSIPSGYLSWKELLRPFASEINLSIDKENDYLSVAQYYFNKHRTRSRINETILNEFTQSAKSNESANIITRLPIKTYWTTNYDHIIEDTLRQNNRKPDVKITVKNLATNLRDCDAVVYKMHGDANFPDSVVLIKDDYETYESERSLFTTVLNGDLVSKTFLFLGFSFEDPNLSTILSKIKTLLGSDVRDHYCIFEKIYQYDGEDADDYAYRKAKQSLVIDDLMRYGIQAVLIDSYSKIPSILREIEIRCNLQNVFLSGSMTSDNSKWTKSDAMEFATQISLQLVSWKYCIVSGYGLGIGSAVITGALAAIKDKQYMHVDEYLKLYPFPQPKPGEDIKALWSYYRQEMLHDCGIAVFMFGNKPDAAGKSVIASGMEEEFKIAKQKGAKIIPIASTGDAAERIYDEISKSPEEYPYLTEYWGVLKDERDPGKVAHAIRAIAMLEL